MSSTPIPGLTPDETLAWQALIGTTVWLPAALDLQLQKDDGISHFEYGTMSALVHQPNQAMRIKELARVTNSALPRMSRTLDRLAKQGWVERQPDPDDGRATRAVLTASGRKKVAIATAGHIATVRALVLDRLEPEQVEQLRAIASTIVAAAGPTGACASRMH
jgi:DNA-binding MarR family transcriptional regulator